MAWSTTRPPDSPEKKITTTPGTRTRDRGRATASAGWIRSGIALAALAGLPQPAAAEWQFIPGLLVRETYTDNVNLAPADEARSDFVTEVAPSVLITATGPRIDLSAAYVLQSFFYAREDRDRQVHTLDARATAEIADELFFVDGMAAISEENISAFGPRPQSNANISDNRAEVRRYLVSPYLRHRLPGGMQGEARFGYGEVRTGSGALSDSTSEQYLLTLTNEPSARNLNWSLQYADQRLDYQDAGDVTLDKYSAGVRYLLTPNFGLTGVAGHEKYSYPTIREVPEGHFWAAGIAWAPSERTNIAASAGHRFFGNTYSLAARLRGRNTAWDLSYKEDITTSSTLFLTPSSIDANDFLNQSMQNTIPDPAVRDVAVDSLVRDADAPNGLSTDVNALSQQVFLQKRAQASVAWNGIRNTMVLTAYSSRREAQTDSLGTNGIFPLSDEDTRQTGMYALLSTQLSSRTRLLVSGEYTRIKSEETTRRDTNKVIRTALVTQFHPRVSGRLELRRIDYDSSQAAGSARENAIAASVLMNF